MSLKSLFFSSTMKWHKLLLLIASLTFIIGAYAESDIEIPDDIDDDEINEDEEILRLLEEKRIVSEKCVKFLEFNYSVACFRWKT